MNLHELVGKKTYIYGTGKFASRIKDILEKENVEVLAFLELNKEISTFEQLPVINSSHFEKLDKIFPVIVGLGNPQADIQIVITSLKESHLQAINPIQFAISAFNSRHKFENYWLTGDLSIYEKNNYQIELARSILNDEKSKEIFDKILTYRKNGRTENLPQKFDADVQYLAPDLPWGNFLQQGVRVLDCGAFDGDTFENFQKHKVKIDYWNFVEPDSRNFAKIKEKFEHALNNVVYTHAGVSNRNGFIGFDSLLSSNGSKFSINTKEVVRTIRIDQLPDANSYNFLKFDIEGEELNALKGAEITLKNNKPCLAISTYHQPSHHWEILNYLSSFKDQYSFFLRVHGEQTFDSILYCFPKFS